MLSLLIWHYKWTFKKFCLIWCGRVQCISRQQGIIFNKRSYYPFYASCNAHCRLWILQVYQQNIQYLAIATWIPDKVMALMFYAFTAISNHLPPNVTRLRSWLHELEERPNLGWVDWWKRPQVLRKLCRAFNDWDDIDDLPGTNNPVESINRQMIMFKVFR